MTLIDTPEVDLAAAGWTMHGYMPLHGHEPMAFPPSLLPESVRDFVAGLSRSLEVPIELPFGACLGVASAVTQSRWQVQIKPGWNEPTSLYIGIAADPGERKSPVLKPIQKPLIQWEREDRERAAKANEANKTKAALIVEQVKAKKREAAKAGDYSDATAKEINDLESQIPPIEQGRRLFADDITPERLLRLLPENYGCLSIITDEGGSFLKAIGGKYNNGTPSIDGVLKGWDNGFVRVDRSNGNDVYLNNARLSLTLLVQKKLAHDILTNSEFMDRGLVHRFIWIMPSNDHIGRRTYEGEPVSPLLSTSWSARIKSLLDWSPAATSDLGTTPHLIKFTDTASEMHHKFALRIERQINQMDEADPRRTYRQKWPGQVARLAGVLHCLECYCGDKPPHDRQITQDAIESAIAIADVLIDHADHAMGLLGQDMRIERARRIVKRMRVLEGPTTQADLWRSMRKARSLFEGIEQFGDAIELLMKLGHVAWLEDGKTTHITLTPPAF